MNVSSSSLGVPGERAPGLIHLSHPSPAQYLALSGHFGDVCWTNEHLNKCQITGRPGFLAVSTLDLAGGAAADRDLEDVAPSRSLSPPLSLQPPLPREPERHRRGRADSGKPSPGAKLLSSVMAGVWCGALPPLSHLRGAGALTQKESEKENFASPPGFHGSWAGPGRAGGGEGPVAGKMLGRTEWISGLLEHQSPTLAARGTEAWKRQLDVVGGQTGSV